MIAQPGSAVWFARHEWRLAWRDWVGVMGGGKPKRLRRAVIAITIFVIFMHFVAYWTVGRIAAGAPDKTMLVTITAAALPGGNGF